MSLTVLPVIVAFTSVTPTPLSAINPVLPFCVLMISLSLRQRVDGLLIRPDLMGVRWFGVCAGSEGLRSAAIVSVVESADLRDGGYWMPDDDVESGIRVST